MSSIATDNSTIRWSLSIPVSKVKEMRRQLDDAFEHRDAVLPDRLDKWAGDTDSLIAACVAQHVLSKLSRDFFDRDVIKIIAGVLGTDAFRDNLDLFGERK